MKKLISLLVIASLIACTKPAGAEPGTGGSKSTNANDSSATTSTITIEGMSPTEYFRQFIHRKVGVCGSDEGSYFLSLLTFHDLLILKRSEDNRGRYGSIQLYLGEDGTYTADYEEMIHQPTEWNQTTYRQEKTVRLNGKWSVNSEGAMVLENLGKATGIKVDGSPGINLTLGVNVTSEEILGQSVMMSLMQSSSDKERIEACPYH